MTFTNREPNENANRKINKRSFVPIQTIQNYFEREHNLQGPFKQDSAKTSAARTSTCLFVNRLSVTVVIRFYKHKTIKNKLSRRFPTFAIAIIFNNRCE